MGVVGSIREVQACICNMKMIHNMTLRETMYDKEVPCDGQVCSVSQDLEVHRTVKA